MKPEVNSHENSTYRCDECQDTGFMIGDKYPPGVPCWMSCVPPKCSMCSNYGWYNVNVPKKRSIIHKKKICYHCDTYKYKITSLSQIKDKVD